MSISSDRIDNARLTEGVLLYLASVGLVAAAIIVLFSVASFSLLSTSKETLTGSRIDNSPIEDVSIGTVVFYPDSNAAPIPVQTKSPSSSEANNLSSSTLIPPSSGMLSEGTTMEPAFKPPPHGETNAMAVETPDGSTRGPSIDETPPPEPSGSQQMIAQPLSSVAKSRTAAVETPHGLTVGPSTEETPPPEPNGSLQMIAQPQSSVAKTITAAVEIPLGSTVGPSTDETPPPEPRGSQPVIAQSSAAETSAGAVKTTHGSPRGPSIDESPSPEQSGSQQVIAQPQSIADEPSAAQHSPGATMPWVATSDGELDQPSQDFEIQSNHHATLDEGSVAFRPESQFPETQVKESAGFSGSGASAGSNPRLIHAASRGRRAVKALDVSKVAIGDDLPLIERDRQIKRSRCFLEPPLLHQNIA